MTPTPDPRPSTVDGDEALRQALRALPPDPDGADGPADLALQRRVLARWAAGHAGAATASPLPAGAAGVGTGGGWRPAGGAPQARRLALAGLVALAAVAAWTGLQRPDPTVDELMRLDVLSQIAAGEL